jgi:hypothetical protein
MHGLSKETGLMPAQAGIHVFFSFCMFKPDVYPGLRRDEASN